MFPEYDKIVRTVKCIQMEEQSGEKKMEGVGRMGDEADR